MRYRKWARRYPIAMPASDRASIEDFPFGRMKKLIAFISTGLLTPGVLPHMSRSGSIIFMGSGHSKKHRAQSAYFTAKHGFSSCQYLEGRRAHECEPCDLPRLRRTPLVENQSRTARVSDFENKSEEIMLGETWMVSYDRRDVAQVACCRSSPPMPPPVIMVAECWYMN